MRRLRSPWTGPVVVALCGALLLGATIRRNGITADTTMLFGGTASRVVVTTSAGTITTSSILQDDGARVTSTGPVHVAAAFHAQTSFALGAHMVTIANNADAGTANTEILAGTRSLYLIDCNDPQGCTLQLGTSNIVQGATTRIFNVSTNANVVTVGNITSVQHVQSLFTMSTNHTMGLMFISNRSGASIWAETNRNGRAL